MPGFQLFPTEASTISSQVDTLFFVMLGVSVLMVTLIGGLSIFFVVKYRRRSPAEIPEQIVGSNRLELAWTIIPLGFFLVIFFWGANIYLNMAQPPPDSMDVYVVAKQWMWKFEQMGGQTEINELHVPVGRPVRLTMTSQDVIHSFFIPDFRVKQDVLPDRYTTVWFQATKTGTYHLFCTQYCGTNHAEMTGTIVVMEPAAFAQWLAGGATAGQSPAAVGANLFQQYGCSSCHQPSGQGPGPSLGGLFGSSVPLQDGTHVTADENYIRESILDPTAKIVAGFQPIMPSFRGRLSEDQILALIAYIRSLGGQTQPGAPAGSTAPPAIAPATTGTPVSPPGGVPSTTPVAGASPSSQPTLTSGAAITPTEEPEAAATTANPGPAINLTGNAANGATIFAANCASCHGPQGKGGVPNPGSADGTVPPLNPIDPAIANQDPKVFARNVDLFVEHGSTPEGTPALKMPAWGDNKLLTPQQIADVIAYIISLNP